MLFVRSMLEDSLDVDGRFDLLRELKQERDYNRRWLLIVDLLFSMERSFHRAGNNDAEDEDDEQEAAEDRLACTLSRRVDYWNHLH